MHKSYALLIPELSNDFMTPLIKPPGVSFDFQASFYLIS